MEKITKAILILIKNGQKTEIQLEDGMDPSLAYGPEYFSSYLKKGYSVLFKVSGLKIAPTRIFLAKELKMEDARLILNAFQNLTFFASGDELKFYNDHAYNFISSNGEMDYEIFEPVIKPIVNEKGEMGNEVVFDLYTVLDLLVRDKINQLTIEEQKVIQEYRTFDLKRILTKWNDFQKIIHAYGGIIVITEEQIVKKSVRKQDHGEETIYELNKIYPNDDYRDLNICGLARKNNSIVIQLSYQTIVCSIPNSLTKFQRKQLIFILEELYQIQKKENLQNHFEFDAAILSGSQDLNDFTSEKTFQNILECIEYLERNLNR